MLCLDENRSSCNLNLSDDSVYYLFETNKVIARMMIKLIIKTSSENEKLIKRFESKAH